MKNPMILKKKKELLEQGCLAVLLNIRPIYKNQLYFVYSAALYTIEQQTFGSRFQ